MTNDEIHAAMAGHVARGDIPGIVTLMRMEPPTEKRRVPAALDAAVAKPRVEARRGTGNF